MNCPNTYLHDLLAELLKTAELSIFDFSDDFVELGFAKETLELFMRNSVKYARQADIVLSVNDHIKNKYSFLNKDIRVLRNATNYYNFDRKSYNRVGVLEKIKDNEKPIIGYSGIANLSRVDSALLDFLLDKRPEWQFVFVGPAKPDFTEKYTHHDNIHLLSTVDYEILPDYLHYFDVAIVPFMVNKHTKGNDLLKLHDYLAMGKPVVSTDIGGAGDFMDVISVARDKDEFLGFIETALKGDNKEAIINRREVAMENSWQKRIGQVADLIKNELAAKENVTTQIN